MKILFLTLTYRIGGAENHMAQIIQHWPDSNDELHVTGLWGGGELRETLSQFAHVHWFKDGFPRRKKDVFLAASFFKHRLSNFLSLVEPDVMMTFLWYPTWIASKVAAKHGIPLVWSVQNDLVHGYRSPAGWVKALLTYRSLKHVTHAITISPGMKDELCKFYRFSRDRISFIPNSIDVKKIHRRSQVPIHTMIAEDSIPSLVFVGRIERQKGWPILLDAVRRTTDLHYRVLILGRGLEEHKLKKRIEKLKLSDRVYFLGFSPNPFPIMRQSQALISTSLWEPFGLVLAEAMALGKPVLATPTHGARLIVQHKKNGFIFRGFSPENVEEGIRWFFSTETQKQLDEIQKNAYARALQFDAPRVAKAYRSCLENIRMIAGDDRDRFNSG